jgi:hypothetical protein
MEAITLYWRLYEHVQYYNIYILIHHVIVIINGDNDNEFPNHGIYTMGVFILSQSHIWGFLNGCPVGNDQ